MSLKKTAFKKLYYDYQITTYRMANVNIHNSLVRKKTIVYDKIKCAVWKGVVSNLGDTQITTQTEDNNFEINLKPENNDIKDGDLVEIFYNDISQGIFTISNIVYNDDHTGTLDNIKVLVKSIENATSV